MKPRRVSDELTDLPDIQAEQDDLDRRFLDAEYEYEMCGDGDA